MQPYTHLRMMVLHNICVEHIIRGNHAPEEIALRSCLESHHSVARPPRSIRPNCVTGALESGLFPLYGEKTPSTSNSNSLGSRRAWLHPFRNNFAVRFSCVKLLPFDVSIRVTDRLLSLWSN